MRYIITTIILIFNLITCNMVWDIQKPILIQEKEDTLTHRIADFFQIEKKLAQKVVQLSLQEGLNPYLIASLFYTESNFNPDAVSPKNYKGIAQIKWAIPYPEVNIYTGITIFKEKLKIAKGDVREAIRLYKGFYHNSAKAKKEVNRVILVMKRLSNEQL